MKNKMKFKIGEFSKLCQVTVKTLRHYEEIGLMIPVEVDEWTGYRTEVHKKTVAWRNPLQATVFSFLILNFIIYIF